MAHFDVRFITNFQASHKSIRNRVVAEMLCYDDETASVDVADGQQVLKN